MTAAILAVTLAVGGWLTIRHNRTTRRDTDITAYLLTIPADSWKR